MPNFIKKISLLILKHHNYLHIEWNFPFHCDLFCLGLILKGLHFILSVT